ncbi:putative nitrilase [Naematelia encephala]|uniref:Putative nitrilase n=1 Tax=Naematelia encephala TaxID=71784 RepID=A0A1Y2AX75_9TREE|nr:putative nitrilase [Naematelia encephala]
MSFIRICAVQAESAWLDLEAGVDKTCALIKEAGEKGCHIIGFSEVFIPGFPFSIYTKAPDEEWILKYQKNSLVLGSPQYNKIRKACRDAKVWAVVGFSERDGSTLYLGQSFIGPTGQVHLHRRKLKPTHVERYVYGDGQAESLTTCVTTDKGVVLGGLNCWEHLQPLLRYHHYNQGVQVHVAAWPYVCPAGPGVPMSSCSDISGDVISRMLAIEGGAFVMTCTAVISKEGSKIMNLDPERAGPAAVALEGGGFTAIYGPKGDVLARSKDQFSEELVIADVDLDDIHRHKQMADCIGHYSRPDLLSLHVATGEMPRVSYSDGRHNKTFAEKLAPLEP